MFTNSWFIPKTVGLKKKTTGCSAGDRNSDKWSPQCELSLLCTLQFIVYGLITVLFQTLRLLRVFLCLMCCSSKEVMKFLT